MFLFREFIIKLCRIYTKIHIYAADLKIILSIISIENKNKNYKIIIGEVTKRFLWEIFVFRLVAYLLNMIY